MGFMIVWNVTCLTSTKKLDGVTKTFLIVDDDGDPRFECPICGCNSNHLPPTKEDDKPNMRINRWMHYKEVVGRVQNSDLIELASKDKRGWKD